MWRWTDKDRDRDKHGHDARNFDGHPDQDRSKFPLAIDAFFFGSVCLTRSCVDHDCAHDRDDDRDDDHAYARNGGDDGLNSAADGRNDGTLECEPCAREQSSNSEDQQSPTLTILTLQMRLMRVRVDEDASAREQTMMMNER